MSVFVDKVVEAIVERIVMVAWICVGAAISGLTLAEVEIPSGWALVAFIALFVLVGAFMTAVIYLTKQVSKWQHENTELKELNNAQSKQIAEQSAEIQRLWAVIQEVQQKSAERERMILMLSKK